MQHSYTIIRTVTTNEIHWAAISNRTTKVKSVALFHETERNRTKPDETERNLTKPSNYCRQMCYKNASNSNKSIPSSMVMRMDNVGNV